MLSIMKAMKCLISLWRSPRDREKRAEKKSIGEEKAEKREEEWLLKKLEEAVGEEEKMTSEVRHYIQKLFYDLSSLNQKALTQHASEENREGDWRKPQH